MSRTITAYFDSRSDAQAAADRLAHLGIPAKDVDIHDSGTAGTTTTTTTGSEDRGFWASLSNLFMPDEDRYAYSEGIRRGGSVLTVRADEVDFDRVSDVLEEAGAVDMDAREAEWRSEGWSGYDADTIGAGTRTVGTADYADRTGYADRTAGAGTSGYTDVEGIGTTGRDTVDAGYAGRETTAGYAAGEVSGREDYIPVAEEELRVGKREVDHGRVRIRSYVHETPVEEHVRLHEERVGIERNPVNRAATTADQLFQERTIEADERAEEAVVSKDARVTEEVRLRKDTEERDETIRDTVRRTDVEVEDERTGQVLTDEERRRRGY